MTSILAVFLVEVLFASFWVAPYPFELFFANIIYVNDIFDYVHSWSCIILSSSFSSRLYLVEFLGNVFNIDIPILWEQC